MVAELADVASAFAVAAAPAAGNASVAGAGHMDALVEENLGA